MTSFGIEAPGSNPEQIQKFLELKNKTLILFKRLSVGLYSDPNNSRIQLTNIRDFNTKYKIFPKGFFQTKTTLFSSYREANRSFDKFISVDDFLMAIYLKYLTIKHKSDFKAKFVQSDFAQEKKLPYHSTEFFNAVNHVIDNMFKLSVYNEFSEDNTISGYKLNSESIIGTNAFEN